MTKKIIEIVTTVTGVTREQIIKQNRRRKIADARKIAMLVCREYTYETYWDLGVLFERDHTTIMHACEVAIQLLDVDANFLKNYLTAKNEVEALGLIKLEIDRTVWTYKRNIIKAA